MVRDEHIAARATIAAPGQAGSAAGQNAADTGAAMAQMMVAYVYDVALDALQGRARGGRRVAEARQVAMYLAHVALKMPVASVGRAFGRDRATVRHACRHIEELREDPQADRRLVWLEALLRAAVGPHDEPAGRRQ